MHKKDVMTIFCWNKIVLKFNVYLYLGKYESGNFKYGCNRPSRRR
jgi:hypothetical protein